MIFLNNSNHTFSSAIAINNETISNMSDIDNIFNNYLTKVAIDIQSSVRLPKNKNF